jgi:hypothetical protein
MSSVYRSQKCFVEKNLKTSSLIGLTSNDTLVGKTVAFLDSIIVSERDTTEESNDFLLQD